LAPRGKPFRPDFLSFHSRALPGAVAQSPLSQARSGKSALGPGAVVVGAEGFVVVRAADLRAVEGDPAAKSEAGAQRRMAELVQGNPALDGEILVVPMFEVNRL